MTDLQTYLQTSKFPRNFAFWEHGRGRKIKPNGVRQDDGTWEAAAERRRRGELRARPSELRIMILTKGVNIQGTRKKYVFLARGPRQGQAEELSKGRKKFLATTYKHFPGALYIHTVL